MNPTVRNYLRLCRVTKRNMHIRKSEFVTEVVLSLFIVVMTLRLNGDPTYSVGAIAVIHSFNVARAVEAYKQAQFDTRYQE